MRYKGSPRFLHDAGSLRRSLCEFEHINTMRISSIFHHGHRFERFLSDAFPWLAISALGLLAVIIVSPAMDIFPDFVAQQSSNNSEAVSFLALAIALLQCNSRPRLGLALIVLAAGLLFIIGNPGLPASVGTHSESFLAAVTIAVWLFLPPSQRRPALLILALVVIVVASQILAPSSPFGLFMTRNAEAAGLIIVFVAITTWVDPPTYPESAMSPVQRLTIAVALGASALGLGMMYPEGVFPVGVVDPAAVEPSGGLVGHIGLWLLRNIESFLVGIGLLLWLEICRRLDH